MHTLVACRNSGTTLTKPKRINNMTELKQFKTATTLAEIVQLAKLTEAESASVR
jgi:hypothetical protein